jgi:hypothetical protein
MNSPNNVIETAQVPPTGGPPPEAAQPTGSSDHGPKTVTSQSTVPVMEWSGTETFLVAVQWSAQRNSTAFRLSF